MKQYTEHIQYKNHEITILRLDIVHPDIQGNKYYKLKYNIEAASSIGKKTLLSFGGEYSNHLHALSIAGKAKKIETIGIIRGDKPEKLNPTLSFCSENGMKLHFATRTQFRILRKLIQENNTKDILELLSAIAEDVNLENTYIIPEGGTNELALKGTQEILDLVSEKYDYICSSIGTAGTIAGIIASSPEKSQILGFPSLKGNFFEKDINNLLQKISPKEYTNWTLKHNYHFGGFAAFNDELIAFNNNFYKEYAIPLDTIYTGKMFYGIFDLIDKGFFNKTDKILAIHTGGLQGIQSFNDKHGNLLHY